MAKLIVHNPPTVKLKASGYQGTPEGNVDLTENNRTYNVSPFATATTAIPEEEKTVTPSTVKQTVTPDNGLLKKVTVEPAPLESKTVTPKTEQQTIVPQSPAIGFSQFTVEPVTPSIDPDIQPENIKQGVDILGVQGALKTPVLIEKTITENGTYAADDDNADGYSEVTVDVPVPIVHIIRITVSNTPDTEMNMAGIKGLTAMSFANNPNLERIINLDASGVSSLDTCFTNCNHLAVLNWTPLLHLTYMGRAFENCNSITEIDFTGTTFSTANWGAAFSACYALVTIYGELDFTSCTNSGDTFNQCRALENVSFKANTIPKSLSFFSSLLLSNASIISIANGLSESVSGQTLTLHADVKNKLSAIFGTVAFDDTQSYHVFIVDSGGTVTLSEFITNTKGWSIA